MQGFSDKNKGNNGRWTAEEHDLFQKGFHLFGRDWKKIEKMVVTRSGSQIRSHAQKYFQKIQKFRDEGENSNISPQATRALENHSAFSKIDEITVNSTQGPLGSFFMDYVSSHLFDFWGLLVEEETLDCKPDPMSQDTLSDPQIKSIAFIPYTLKAQNKSPHIITIQTTH